MSRSESVVSADGFALHTEVSGGGEPLLLGLHGGPGGEGGSYMAPLHTMAGPARTVVTFDQLGTGRSDVPPASYPWSVEAAVADVEAVREHFAAERIDLLGHSWGGMLALQYTLDHPARVRRLVLSGTVPSTALAVTGFLRQLLGLLTPAEASGALTADATADHADAAFLAATRQWLAAFSTNAGPDAEPTDELVKEALDPGPAGRGLWGERLWFATGALRGWDVVDRLAEIRVPTLAIHGGHDMSSADVNGILASAIPDCEWITLNRNGHGMFDEPNVEVYLSVVSAFLGGWRLPPRDGAR